MTLDGYANEYDAGETSEVVVDFIMVLGVAAISFATLIALVMLYRWFKKKGPKLG